MKAVLVIFACIALALVLKVVDYFTSDRNIKSVGAKSNRASRNIPKIDITNKDELDKALEYYKNMTD